jgi:hypothetical protein
MATNGVNFTYPDAARRESLLDIVVNIDPTEHQLVSGLQRSSATNTLHEWVEDTLESVGANAQFEGGDAPTDVAANPVRKQNVTQIFAKTAVVTNTELAVNRVGGNRMAQEITKKIKALKNDIEFALVRGSIASGVASNAGAGSARQLQGIKNWFTGTATTNTSNFSGATLTETVLNDMFETVWNNSSKQVDAVYTTMKGKRRISGFTAGSTKNVDASDKRLVNAVDVYQSDAASMVKLFAHRYVTISGDYVTTATPGFDVLALNEGSWAVAYLSGREPKTVDLAKTGDAEKKEIVTELTLEARGARANYYGKLFF